MLYCYCHILSNSRHYWLLPRAKLLCGCGHDTFFQTKLSLGVYAGLASGGVAESLLLDAFLQCPFLRETLKQVLQPLPVMVALSDAR